MDKDSKIELAKNTSLEIAKIGIEELADNILGKLSFGIITTAISTRNKFNAEKLIERLKNSEIELNDELIQSNEFLGFTVKTLTAINAATKKNKIEFLLNIYVNGLNDSEFFQKSEKFAELMDIVSSLSEDSIILLIEIYKDFIKHGRDLENNNILRITDNLNIGYDDFLSHCYFLTGKGLLKQVQLASGGFFPLPSSWLESLFYLLENEPNLSSVI